MDFEPNVTFLSKITDSSDAYADADYAVNDDVTAMEMRIDNETGLPSYYYPGDIHQLTKPWVTVNLFIPLVVIYCFVFLTGVTGNSLVIAALCLGRAGRCATFPCLVSMAWADVLFLLICVPHYVVKHFVVHWTLSEFMCKLSGFVENMSVNATVLNLVLVSVERYMVIAHPLTSKILCTAKNARIALACIWIAAIMMASPNFVLMGTETNKFHNNVTSVVVVMCANFDKDDRDRKIYAMAQLVALFIIPICVLLFCYTRVISILWISARQLQTLTLHNSRNNSPRTDPGRHLLSTSNSPATSMRSSVAYRAGEDALAARKQIIKMLIIIIVIFLVCWGPKLIVTTMKTFRINILYFYSSYFATVIFECLSYFQSCINPIIYTIMSKNIRNGMRHVLTSCCRSRWCLPRWWPDSPTHEMVHTNHSHLVATRFDTTRTYGGSTKTATSL